MKQGLINKAEGQGYLFSHKLEVKVVKSEASASFGQTYISGSVTLVNPENTASTMTFQFNFVKEMTKAGKENKTFAALKSIIETGRTFPEMGTGATRLSISGEFDINDFYAKDSQDMVSAKIIKGNFLNTLANFTYNESKAPFNFSADMLITGTSLVEADADNGREADELTVSGFVFNDYFKSLVPVDLTVTNENGIRYFDELTFPAFANVWGVRESSSICNKIVTENGFGGEKVDIVEKTWHRNIITGIAAELYPYGDADFITEEEFKKCLNDREVRLAEIKTDAINRAAASTQANSGFAATPAAATTAPATGATGNFTF